MRMSVEIPVEPEATSLVRDVVTRMMVDSTAPQERVEDVLLLTTEVVSHAVRLHPDSGGSIGLLLDVSSDRLRVEVTDQLGGPDPRSMPSRSGGEADGGWGLIFVAELSDRWGAEPDSIWFELAL